MTQTKQNKIICFYSNLKSSTAIRLINKFVYSPYGIAFLGVLTLIAQVFALELMLYTFVGVYVTYVCLFCNDLLPLMPLFVFCYVAVSDKNNPGFNANSIFYTQTLWLILIIAISVTAILLRIGFDKTIGFKKLFTCKKSLLIGMLVLGGAYLLSGIGSTNYEKYVLNNLLFSFIQFLSIFLLYFVFSATADWKNTNKSYFAWLGLIWGFVVSLELLNIYVVKNVIENGTIIRGRISTGWATYNNLGAVIAMSIPFAFYLASKSKYNYVYLGLATIQLFALVCSCSRGSIVGGALIYVVSLIITFIKADHKKSFRISTTVLAGIGIIVLLVFSKQLIELFKKVPSIISSNNGELKFNDSSRFVIYKNGFNAFLNFPIFGQSFFPTEFVPYEHPNLEAFTSFFPPRWHNTVIQILSSCGMVGMLAYLFHRFQTIKLIFKNNTPEKTYIGLSIACLLIMSLLDCHFFNVGPVLFYSMALAFAEHTKPDNNNTTTMQSDNNNENFTTMHSTKKHRNKAKNTAIETNKNNEEKHNENNTKTVEENT